MLGPHDIAFSQGSIQQIAQRLTPKNVQNARISQHTNADHPNSTYAYLKAVGSRRRLASPCEVPAEKAIPLTLLPPNAPILRHGPDILVFSDLLTWVQVTYSEMVAKWPIAAQPAAAAARPIRLDHEPKTLAANSAGSLAASAENEVRSLKIAGETTDELRRFLVATPSPSPHHAAAWLAFTLRMREIQGNLSNTVSLAAGILARDYLVEHAGAQPYDAVAKAQGAPGLDIEGWSNRGTRIVGEIKTTVAYGETDLGAQQRATFLKDFAKLQEADNAERFFFLVDRRTFEIVRHRYSTHLPTVTVVLLPEGDTYHVNKDGRVEDKA